MRVNYKHFFTKIKTEPALTPYEEHKIKYALLELDNLMSESDTKHIEEYGFMPPTDEDELNELIFWEVEHAVSNKDEYNIFVQMN